MELVTKTCPHCGGNNITCDAAMRWNVLAGQWEVASIYDDYNCDTCGETSQIETQVYKVPFWVIVNAERDFWNMEQGWVRKFKDATRFDDTDTALPIDGQWLIFSGVPDQFVGHHYRTDAVGGTEHCREPDPDGGYSIALELRGSEGDHPTPFDRYFPGLTPPHFSLGEYWDELAERFGDLERWEY